LKRAIFPFLLGFLSISVELLLLREFLPQFYGNEAVYGFVLGFWFLWGSVGSLLANKLRLQPKHLLRIFRSTLVIAIVVFVFLRLSRFIYGKPFGESLGITPAFLTALICCALLSFPFGLLFFLNVDFFRGNITAVYTWESLGAGIAGLAVNLLLVPHFTCWQSLGLIVFISLALIILVTPSLKSFLISGLIITLAAGFMVLDFPLQKMAARPFPLIKSHDSRFGRWQAVKIDYQLTLYQDGQAATSIPDQSEAEEIVHLPLLQRPELKRLLLIGGGMGGAIEEAFKYPNVEIDYVEIDPDLIRLTKPLLSPSAQHALDSPRVKIHHLDGRAFLHKTANKYEVILLAVPEPGTAQLNRFYTREFFALVKNRLTSDGLVSLRVASAENYQNLSLRRFLSSLYQTLSSIFAQVQVIPGDTNIFLASDGKIDISLDYFASSLEKYQISTQFVRPQVLSARLTPWRLIDLEAKITTPLAEPNLDLLPRGYLYYLTFWASQFSPGEVKIFDILSRIHPRVLFALPLFIVLIIFAPLLANRGLQSLPALPLIILGFTTMLAETLILLWFQTKFGFIYEKISLLIAFFMLGLFIGAILSRKISFKPAISILIDVALFVILLSFLWLFLPVTVPIFVPYIFLFLLGAVGGHLFIVSNSPLIRGGQSYGLGYGLDLAGSFLGASLGPFLFFPVLGLPGSVASLLTLNILGLIFFLPYVFRQSPSK